MNKTEKEQKIATLSASLAKSVIARNNYQAEVKFLRNKLRNIRDRIDKLIKANFHAGGSKII